MSCSDEYSYFSSADFMASAFHVLTSIEVPVHIFVGYVILFKTPSRMGNVKWFMFHVHFWSAILDVSFTFLVTPYFIFPATAGYSLGAFIWIGLDPAIQVTVLVVEIGSTSNSAMLLQRTNICLHLGLHRCRKNHNAKVNYRVQLPRSTSILDISKSYQANEKRCTLS
ncbi:G protein-coupled receptor [Caenorhabditis elegans]|uniref:G protein-coupled receptor n=1 Tax=Caenorhabditis elegans TaxID=6239 RepID=A0A163VU50_CAEEL|nr:G protein-coupled receptor [Caenorhabditis elegans]SAP35558.1 G protein-coupled receptor [Caenorhabditis elegans]|eukprot:NP_001317800.1 Serpentine Receptor, class H [Caenorhabditis elegans]